MSTTEHLSFAHRFLEDDSKFLLSTPTCGLLEGRYYTVFSNSQVSASGEFVANGLVVAQFATGTVTGLSAMIRGAELERRDQIVLIKNPKKLDTAPFALRFGEQNAVYYDHNSGIVFAGRVTVGNDVTLARPVVKSFQEYFKENLLPLQAAFAGE